jgi:hypothetical protein
MQQASEHRLYLLRVLPPAARVLRMLFMPYMNLYLPFDHRTVHT